MPNVNIPTGDNPPSFPVGINLGCDDGFMARIARTGGTADKNGQST
jgi:hypothetical protein